MIAFACFASPACTGFDKAQLALDAAAERATYNAVADEWLGYVDADPSKDEAAKARRHKLALDWNANVEAKESAAK